MYNRITLIGTLANHPEEIYDPYGDLAVLLSLKVPPPPDAPQTHWGIVYDLRRSGSGSGWPAGHDTFLVICREPLLAEKCLQLFHKGNIVCVEGRLVLTLLRLHTNGDDVPLAEILASDVILITEHTSERS